MEKEKINIHIEKKLYPNSLYRAAGLQTSNGFFCSVNHLSGGGVNTNHNATHYPAWPAKTKLRMTLNCSRIAKEVAMISAIFVEGRRQTLLYSCKRKEQERTQTASKKTSRSLPETMRNRVITSSEPWNTEANKVDRNAPITSKHVFPKRSTKMIDVTEKPKMPSKFAKCAARYNGFCYNVRSSWRCWLDCKQYTCIDNFKYSHQIWKTTCKTVLLHSPLF